MEVLSFFVISLFVLSFIFLSVIVFFYIKSIKEEEDLSKNDILINLDNHTPAVLGIVNDIREGRGGRSLVLFTKKGEKYKLITNNYVDLKNTLDDRKVVINFPKYSEDLNKKIKESSYFSEKISNFVENKNNEENLIKTLREANLRKNELNVLMGGGELSSAFINSLLKFAELKDKLAKEDKTKK